MITSADKRAAHFLNSTEGQWFLNDYLYQKTKMNQPALSRDILMGPNPELNAAIIDGGKHLWASLSNIAKTNEHERTNEETDLRWRKKPAKDKDKLSP